MPQPEHSPVAALLADWVEGAPSDDHLGMLLTNAAFDLTLQGRTPAPDPQAWEQLVRQGRPGWERRLLLAAEVLQLLRRRGVDVTTDPAAEGLALEEAVERLGAMASASGDPDLKGVDWRITEGEVHAGGA